MDGCQNYGPFWGTLNNRCRSIIGTQKGTIILTKAHMYIHTYIHTYIQTHTYMHAHVHMQICVSRFTVYACIGIALYSCSSVRSLHDHDKACYKTSSLSRNIRVFIYTHTYIHTDRPTGRQT